MQQTAIERTASRPGWWGLLRDHARLHLPAALGLTLALLAVLALLVESVAQLAGGVAAPGLRLALLGGGVAFAATALGALPALVLRGLPQRVEDSLLGMAAGMMLAASAFSLLLPGLESAAEILGSKPLGAGVVVIGMALGVLLMLGLDQFTPHEHDKTGPCGPGHERCGRIWLFVFAIALHNLPEGMAIGVAFSQADMAVGLPLTTAIALQDLPEGLAVALALRGAGFAPGVAVLVAAASGLLEPLGALLGVGLSSGLILAYPAGLGLAAGAMLFVVSHEVIPETHRNGHQTAATVGLMLGFAVMMVLDTTLGK
ncbi:MAG: ZIP family metal transporter [Betaproteobacteria bacterium]|nr:ZIP family metal transporter [Betaproteobacteria bacterium]